jgi:4-methyl-5(b-hydroxyethyl)-thiazole monophosphate biosynthesis
MVFIHLATGFEEIEAITIVDVLRRAGLDAKTVSITGNYMVKGAHDVEIKADLLFEEANYNNCHMIILPGGMPGTTNLAKHEGLEGQIKRFAEEGRLLAAICAAPMVFGGLNLLEGRTAVIYPGMEDHLKGANIGEGNVAIDKNIITSRGPGTAMEFALTLAEILKDKTVAKNLRKAMILD